MQSTMFSLRPVDTLHPYVSSLRQTLIKLDRLHSLEQAIHDAIHGDRIAKFLEWRIVSADAFFAYASYLLTSWAPSEDRDGRYVYYVLMLFYYVFEKAQLRDLQTPIHPSSILSDDKPAITAISSWICGFATRMGAWLDTPPSITAESYSSFLTSPKYRMHDYHHPDPAHPTGGFRNFNELFCRRLRSPYPYTDVRPLAGLDDPNTVVFPADSTFDGAWPIDSTNHVTITSSSQQHVDSKGLKWPIATLLAGSQHASRFAGGVWAHAFLNTFDYHRLHAPVAGTVVEAKNIAGLCMMQVVATPDNDTDNAGNKTHSHSATPGPRRRFSQPTHLEGVAALTDGTAQLPGAPNDAGYQFLQTRGLVVIDTHRADVGLVAVLPMGMATVSSVKLSVEPGDSVRKGDEIAWFEFGGSDIVLVFEPGADVGAWAVDGEHHLMGERLAVLRSDAGCGEIGATTTAELDEGNAVQYFAPGYSMASAAKEKVMETVVTVEEVCEVGGP